jgi:diguanylate cyclase (GGDEF)-like protein
MSRSAVLSQLSYSDLFERLQDAGFLLEPETWRVLAQNPAAERIVTHSSAAQESGCFLTDILVGATEAELERVQKEFRVCVRRYHSRTFEIALPDRVFQVQACQLEKDGQKGAVLQVLMRDVTDLKHAEKALAEHVRKLEELSTTDELTALPNRRSFDRALEQEHVRSLRFYVPYSILFIDVDHFKNYNDRNGHPAGDVLLKRLGGLLKKACRDTDLPARYGGEEFVVLCPGVVSEQAKILADRICSWVAQEGFDHAEGQPLGRVTVSIGIAHFSGNTESPHEVKGRADQALYQSKILGRNRATLAEKSQHPEIIKENLRKSA